jgi:hypothetical protein
MHIHIENPETTEFLNLTDGWSRQLIEAKIFPNITAAMRAGRQLAVGRFNVIGHLPGGSQYLNLQHGRGTGRLDITPSPATSAVQPDA